LLVGAEVAVVGWCRGGGCWLVPRWRLLVGAEVAVVGWC
jgi:hypothetical protein